MGHYLLITYAIPMVMELCRGTVVFNIETKFEDQFGERVIKMEPDNL